MTTCNDCAFFKPDACYGVPPSFNPQNGVHTRPAVCHQDPACHLFRLQAELTPSYNIHEDLRQLAARVEALEHHIQELKG